MENSARNNMVARQFGQELGNLKKDAKKATKAGRNRRGKILAKQDFHNYSGWSRAGMVPIDQLKRRPFSHKDMVEILWEMYRNNW